MAATRRILAASSRPELFEALQNQTARRERWSIAGPVDPKIPGLFEQACDDVDVALIEADDLVWLANNRAKTVGTALQRTQRLKSGTRLYGFFIGAWYSALLSPLSAPKNGMICISGLAIWRLD